MGQGKGVWDYVHVSDLANPYALVLTRTHKRKEVLSGEAGFLFSATGRYTWRELSNGISNVLFKLGKLKTAGVGRMSIQEAADRWSSVEKLYVGCSSDYRV